MPWAHLSLPHPHPHTHPSPHLPFRRRSFSTATTDHHFKPFWTRDCDPNPWRGTIGTHWGSDCSEGSDWVKWHANYLAFLLHYAVMAGRLGVEGFVVTHELYIVNENCNAILENTVAALRKVCPECKFSTVVTRRANGDPRGMGPPWCNSPLRLLYHNPKNNPTRLTHHTHTTHRAHTVHTPCTHRVHTTSHHITSHTHTHTHTHTLSLSPPTRACSARQSTSPARVLPPPLPLAIR